MKENIKKKNENEGSNPGCSCKAAKKKCGCLLPILGAAAAISAALFFLVFPALANSSNAAVSEGSKDTSEIQSASAIQKTGCSCPSGTCGCASEVGTCGCGCATGVCECSSGKKACSSCSLKQ